MDIRRNDNLKKDINCTPEAHKDFFENDEAHFRSKVKYKNVGSPLDQFGLFDDVAEEIFDSFVDLADGEFPGGLVVLILGGIFEFINEFVDDIIDGVVFLVTGLASIVGGVDESSDDSDWDDNNDFFEELEAYICTSNLFGLITGSDTGTSLPTTTFLLSVLSVMVVVYQGLSLHGLRFFSILYPVGTPTVMVPFIISIEVVSYLARLVSLGMRLFANMFAGHTLLKILISFMWAFLMSAIPVLVPVLAGLLVIIVLLEAGIAYLQSFVFVTLVMMYSADAVSLQH